MSVSAKSVGGAFDCGCPMVESRWIVVGIDGVESGFRALDWAAEEAERRGLFLRVVHVFPPGSDDDEERAAALIDAAVNRVRERLPDLVVRGEAIPGVPGEVLVAESQTEELLVIGVRSNSGSVGRHCIDFARCPMALVYRGLPQVAKGSGA
jgi:nucleotide-binding universal stress UspA family protein